MRIRSAAAVAAVILLCLPIEAATLDMHIDDLAFANGKFEFTPQINEPADPPPPQPKASQLIGHTPGYEIWMDRDGVEEKPDYNYFDYNLYVRPKGNHAQVTRIAFHGKPTGTFNDQLVKVHFKIIDGAVTEEGDMMLPVFGSAAPEPPRSPPQTDPQDVYLATEKEIPVPLVNPLKELKVDITGATAASRRDPALWQPVEARGPGETPEKSKPFAPFTIEKDDKDEKNLNIRFVPRPQHAFATALVRGKDSDDDVITVSVTYKTLGRSERPTSFDVHVRFHPWPPVLFLVSSAGSVVGWLLLLLVKAKKEELKERLLILGSGAAAAALIEFFGMVLYIGKSEFKILDFNLDPFQMPTAAIVGLIAGLAGYKSRDFLRRISDTEFFRFREA